MAVGPLHIYSPGIRFPSFSVTGDACQLHCAHCNHHWLRGMVPTTTPEMLWERAIALEARGGVGLLLSGGCDSGGSVPLEPFLPTVARMVSETSLIINAHTGLVTPELATGLAGAGVQVVSVDLIGSSDTVRDVIGIESDHMEYVGGVRLLRDAGVGHIVPHLCVGLDHGSIVGEYEALHALKGILEPEALVIIALIPTPGTPMENVTPPSAEIVAGVIREARSLFLDTHILLGCMRDRGTPGLEREAIKAGVDGIVNPSRETVARVVEGGREIISVEGCCAMASMGR